jgi:hypothetical protein
MVSLVERLNGKGNALRSKSGMEATPPLIQVGAREGDTIENSRLERNDFDAEDGEGMIHLKTSYQIPIKPG